jgi:hypothetical protein
MMNNRILRLAIGISVVISILITSFAILPGWIHTWGAAADEITRQYPGDELISDASVIWTHGIGINATPEEVWPWVAQIGDRRAGFYSYTFIENLIAGEKMYVNANHLIPEYQEPVIGGWLIEEMLRVEDFQPDSYLLGYYNLEDFFSWTWSWNLFKSAEGTTRLVMRMRIGAPQEGGGDMGLAGSLIDVSGFVMERRMLQGIKDRSEGRVDPPFSELIEIVLWLAALCIGLLAGMLTLRKGNNWPLALSAGIDSIIVLMVLTFVQPPLWIRALLDIVLLGALWLAIRVQLPVSQADN